MFPSWKVCKKFTRTNNTLSQAKFCAKVINFKRNYVKICDKCFVRCNVNNSISHQQILLVLYKVISHISIVVINLVVTQEFYLPSHIHIINMSSDFLNHDNDYVFGLKRSSHPNFVISSCVLKLCYHKLACNVF